jgi:exodeoxyribonuclease X
MTDWTSLRFVVIDVEGNGHQPPDLVELAAVPITSGVIGEPSNWLVRPDQPIKYFATRIHGLTDQDVADAPMFDEVADDVLYALDVDAIVAHNAHVDLNVLRRKLSDWKTPEVFDTLRLSRHLFPTQPSYRLGALVETFQLADGLPKALAPHRATYDALVTARLFVRLAAGVQGLEALRGDPSEGGEDETPPLF